MAAMSRAATQEKKKSGFYQRPVPEARFLTHSFTPRVLCRGVAWIISPKRAVIGCVNVVTTSNCLM